MQSSTGSFEMLVSIHQIKRRISKKIGILFHLFHGDFWTECEGDRGMWIGKNFKGNGCGICHDAKYHRHTSQILG